jgi:hypothetical protein
MSHWPMGKKPFKTSLSYESALLSAPEELKCELGRWFWRRDRVAGKDFCWTRPVILDDDRTLESILPISTYREHRYVLPCCSMLCPFSPPSQRQLLHWKIENIKIFSIIVYKKEKIAQKGVLFQKITKIAFCRLFNVTPLTGCLHDFFFLPRPL